MGRKLKNKRVMTIVVVLAMIMIMLPVGDVFADGSVTATKEENSFKGSGTTFEFSGNYIAIKQANGPAKCWTAEEISAELQNAIRERVISEDGKGNSDNFTAMTFTTANPYVLVQTQGNGKTKERIYSITSLGNGRYRLTFESETISHVIYGTYPTLSVSPSPSASTSPDPSVSPSASTSPDPSITPEVIETVEPSNPPFVPIIPSSDPTVVPSEEPALDPTEEPMVEISEEPTKEPNFDVEDPNEEVVDVEEPTDYKLGPVVTEEPKTAEAVNDETPKTGDSNNTVQYVIMLLGSVFGLVLLYRRNRKIIG